MTNITDFINWTNLTSVFTSWIQQLGKYYEINTYLRNQTLNKLTARYWFDELVMNRINNASTSTVTNL